MRASRNRGGATTPGPGVRSLDDLHDVLAFFEARRGSLHAFRFRDPFDMESCRPGRRRRSRSTRRWAPATAPTARFRLVKTYGEGDGCLSDALIAQAGGPGRCGSRSTGARTSSPDDSSFDDATGEMVFAAAQRARRGRGGDGGVRVRRAGAFRHRAHRGEPDQLQGGADPVDPVDRGAVMSRYPEA